MGPEIRLLLANFSAEEDPSSTGGAVSADVAAGGFVEAAIVRALSSVMRFVHGAAELMIDLSEGDFATALSSNLSQQWSQPVGDEHMSVPEYFQAIEKHAGLQRSISDSWQQLQIAIAAFLTFTQANLTG